MIESAAIFFLVCFGLAIVVTSIAVAFAIFTTVVDEW